MSKFKPGDYVVCTIADDLDSNLNGCMAVVVKSHDSASSYWTYVKWIVRAYRKSDPDQLWHRGGYQSRRFDKIDDVRTIEHALAMSALSDI